MLTLASTLIRSARPHRRARARSSPERARRSSILDVLGGGALRWRLGVAEASQTTHAPRCAFGASSRAQGQLPVRASASAQPWVRSARGWRFIAARAALRTEKRPRACDSPKNWREHANPKMHSERDMARHRAHPRENGPALARPRQFHTVWVGRSKRSGRACARAISAPRLRFHQCARPLRAGVALPL